MFKSLACRSALAALAFLGAAGCAHQQAAVPCSSCQGGATAVAASAPLPVWNVVRSAKGDAHTFLLVPTADVKEAAAERVPAAAPPAYVSPSPMPAAPAQPAVTSVPVYLAEPKADAQASPYLALKPVPEAPKTEIAANPNLKPGVREIVRDNVAKTYAHADDYAWVMGELEYQSAKKTWRIRYARFDEDDKFGGCFTLVGADEKLEKFQHGDMVKVDGFPADAGGRRLAPEYSVSEILPLVTREVVDVKVEEKK